MALNLGPINVPLFLKGIGKYKRDTQAAAASTDGLGATVKRLAATYLTLQGALQAFDMGKTAAQFQDASRIFKAAGGELDLLRKQVRGLVDDASLVKKANLARTMGIDSEAFGKLAEAAIAASKATGESVDFMLDSIVKGVARGSPMILDNLGITVSLSEANAAYAKELGKAADKLTKAEQSQAVLNATLKATGPIIDTAAKAGADAADAYSRFEAKVKNLATALGGVLKTSLDAIMPLLEGIVDMYQELFDWMSGAKFDTHDKERDALAALEKQVQKATRAYKDFRDLRDQDKETGKNLAQNYLDTNFPKLAGMSHAQAQQALLENVRKQQSYQDTRKGELAEAWKPPATAAAGGDEGVDFDVGPRGFGSRGPDSPEVRIARIMRKATADYEEVLKKRAAAEKKITDHIRETAGAADKARDSLAAYAVNIPPTTEAEKKKAEATLKAAAAAEKFAAQVSEVINAILAGNAGSMYGQQAGAELGQQIGGMFGAGPLGGVLGGVLGNAMGSSLDELFAAVGVLAPAFDAIGAIIGGLRPAFDQLRRLVEIVAGAFRKSLAPYMEIMGEAIGKLLYPIGNLLLALEPFAVLLLHLAMGPLTTTIMILEVLAGWLTQLAEAGKFLVEAWLGLANTVVDLINSFILQIRNLKIGDWKPFEDFGALLPRFNEYLDDYQDAVDREIEARDESTRSLREFNEELSNVPIGVRKLRRLQFESARGELPGGSGTISSMFGGQLPYGV